MFHLQPKRSSVSAYGGTLNGELLCSIGDGCRESPDMVVGNVSDILVEDFNVKRGDIRYIPDLP